MLQGLPSLSVNWGAWGGSGMAAAAGIARMERLGFGAIPAAAGILAISAVLRALTGGAPVPQLTGSVFFWDRWGLYRSLSTMQIRWRTATLAFYTPYASFNFRFQMRLTHPSTWLHG